MKILVVASNYPHPAYSFSGVFNERCVQALTRLGHRVEVLVPRPYAPPLLSSLVPRWRAYTDVVHYEVRDGVRVYRPVYLQIPRIGGVFWTDPGAFFWCHRTARKMHRHVQFDAIISFDLVAAGGMAWRIGKDLRIPASGWATGGDVRYPASSSYGRALLRAINRLDLVFYQSHELLGKVAELLSVSPRQLLKDRHVVLPRGIPAPPQITRFAMRNQTRLEWGIRKDEILVLYIGRIVRDKGIFELLKAISSAALRDPRIVCVLVGSKPGFDETAVVQKNLDQTAFLKDRVKILPNCNPEKVWEYLCAADIFAFPSHEEGMPNSLLESMAMEVPAVAFAIPPVSEIEGGTGALVTVPPLDSALFADAILRLAANSGERSLVAKRGKKRVLESFMVDKNMAHAIQRLAEVIEKGNNPKTPNTCHRSISDSVRFTRPSC